MTEPYTRTLELPGATLHYDVRGALPPAGSSGGAGAPVLVLAGSPMDASGFTTLASYFTDRAVVTYDPRGTGRSVRTDPGTEVTPAQHAEDLRRVIEALGAGAVELFGTSGGAVNGLALVAAHPELVRTFVAHEPPVAEVLPDRAEVLAVGERIHRAYLRGGSGPAMARFIELVQHRGPLPEGYAERPAPDPAAFGLPIEDDGSRDHPLVGQNLRNCLGFRPDFAALAAASTRIVVAVGKESEGEMAARGAVGVAERLGVAPTVFPSHHVGFLGDEAGMQGEPDAFAAALRHALDLG